MNTHADFYDYLGTLNSTNELQSAYSRYKDSSFELNGRLKSGLPPGELQELWLLLRKIICARSTSDLVLYRMTSRSEFTGPILSAFEKTTFRYSAFMSASGHADKIHSFTPNHDPVVLKISCSAGTTMALMEAKQGSNEDEYLLGDGTEFKIGNPQSVSDPSVASKYTGNRKYEGPLTILPLTVESDPPYVSQTENFFSF